MAVHIRKMHDKEARSFLDVHHSAVRGIAAKDYSQAVVEDWAPLPITEKRITAFLENPDDEIRLVAEIDGEIVGVGALVLEKNELRACYVAPKAARKGIGSALVMEIEKIAREHGLTNLQLDSSITAEPLYRAHGYKVIAHGEHELRSGQRMESVKMEKSLLTHDSCDQVVP